MSISKSPPMEQMNAADVARYSLDEVAVEHPVQSDVAASLHDLKPVHPGFRYQTVKIVGLAKPVRIRSLTLQEFEKDVRTAEGIIDNDKLVAQALCDTNGHNYCLPAQVHAMRQDYDARTWNHLLAEITLHCLGGDLETLAEQAEGN